MTLRELIEVLEYMAEGQDDSMPVLLLDANDVPGELVGVHISQGTLYIAASEEGM